MRYLGPLDRIIGHFCREGYSVSVGDGVVWLSRDGSKGAVWVVPIGGGLDEILWAVMGATEYANRFGNSYVALPVNLAKRIDESHFWTYGIGLLVYDEDMVREILQPRPRAEPREQATTHPEESDVETDEERSSLDNAILEELLRRVERLEREIAKLEELELLMARVGVSESRAGTQARTAQRPLPLVAPATIHYQAEHAVKSISHSEEKLPSYLQNNPWIEVLASKR
ncbi:hypothetical protein HRbin02_01643 [Candidatus Calditenuaceae archaeon HR02]|nr:hypothetical protein HRbin02_01643 [Candidatus Calditenuaceae archaeon HR02]